jgi:uncharacterized Zn-binding protein involved in type VI secretion
MDVLEMAGVGHRITHEDDLPPPRGITAVAVQMLSVQPRPPGGRASAQLGRTFTVQSMGELDGEDPGEAPDPTGVIEKGSVDTFIGRDMRPVAIADEEIEVPCENDSDGPILTGAKTVFVNGMPVVRRTDELDCGAYVGEGEPTVLVTSERTERVKRRPEASPITRGPVGGSLFGRDMQTMQNHSPAEISRTLAGARDLTRTRRRGTARAGQGTRVGRQLTQRNNAALVRTITQGR